MGLLVVSDDKTQGPRAKMPTRHDDRDKAVEGRGA